VHAPPSSTVDGQPQTGTRRAAVDRVRVLVDALKSSLNSIVVEGRRRRGELAEQLVVVLLDRAPRVREYGGQLAPLVAAGRAKPMARGTSRRW
jgi:hypothetical protein